jgi:hypothetical protein
MMTRCELRSVVRRIPISPLIDSKPVTLHDDERYFAHGRSVVSRDNVVPIKSQQEGYERLFGKLPENRHWLKQNGPAPRHGVQG